MSDITTLRVLSRPPGRDGRSKPLLCFPYAGGGATVYETWQQLMPETVEPLTLRLPGRESRIGDPIGPDLRGLAAEIAHELGPHLKGRFAIFGHSMGAIVGYEVAQALRESFGIQPTCLLVSGMRAPDDAKRLTEYSRLDDDGLRSVIKQMGGTDTEVLDNSELWDLVHPVIRSDLAMFDAYVHQATDPLTCPLVAYGSRKDPDLSEESLSSWKRFTTGVFQSRMFPGDHFYFQRWPDAFAMDLINRLYQHVLGRNG